MGKLMIEVFEMVKSVKFIRIKGPRQVRRPGIRPQKLPESRDLPVFEHLPGD